MQVTLTPHAEQLLRQALARNPDRSPEEVLEQALAECIGHEGVSAPPDPVWERLKTEPDVELPDHWPPRFRKFEPLQVAGEPVSEQLIRERR